MPQIIAAMDEDSKITRLMACRIVDVLLKVCGRQFEEDKFTNTYTGKCKNLIFLIFWFLIEITVLKKYSCFVHSLAFKDEKHHAGAVSRLYRFRIHCAGSPPCMQIPCS